MDEGRFFKFLNKLETRTKVVLLVLLIGIALSIIGGIFYGIPAEICVFNFRPLALTLCIVGGIVSFFATGMLFAVLMP